MPKTKSRTWWGNRFLQALESFTDPARLQRGRSYASPSRILKFWIEEGTVYAQIRGNINPYFGVYSEPTYVTQISITPIPEEAWPTLITQFSKRASTVAKLLLNEMPESIEESFAEADLNLLPAGRQEFKTACTCPDWSNPCKHIAGLCYRLAQDLDQDPFLLFDLRGLDRDTLQKELAKTPLGEILSAQLNQQDLPPNPSESYFTRPQLTSVPAIASLQDYWTGSKRLPQNPEPDPSSGVSAILIKKLGDNPSFWHKDRSFVEVMEEFYERIRTQSKRI